jgi:hypothetical protein
MFTKENAEGVVEWVLLAMFMIFAAATILSVSGRKIENWLEADRKIGTAEWGVTLKIEFDETQMHPPLAESIEYNAGKGWKSLWGGSSERTWYITADRGTAIQLYVLEVEGVAFVGWRGECEGIQPTCLVVTTDAKQTVIAAFATQK